jgi:hypothetical protein
MAALRITGRDDGEWMEVRPQIHAGDRRVAGHLKIIERSPERVVVYTRYDPGLVIEKHSHLANEVLFVVEGELIVDERVCPAGTTLVLEKGTPFGPLMAGPEGTVLFETFDGETGHISEDYEGFLRILAERDITILPEPDASVPAQGAGR